MGRVMTVMGWSFSQWAEAHAYYLQERGIKAPASSYGARAVQRFWKISGPSDDGFCSVWRLHHNTPHDWPWAARMFDAVRSETQFWANLGQEKGVDGHEPPTP